ncbi:MAG TPA: MFS transporter [Terracidiphilus sp.]|nr:MFS transporter [Terracidiphilus sp.]
MIESMHDSTEDGLTVRRDPERVPAANGSKAKESRTSATTRVFYGWWIVAAAFLNLFVSVGVIYYGFPVFYPSFVSALGFSRAQVAQGFLLGFLGIGVPFGILAGVLIDKIGARPVILSGVGFIGAPLVLMSFMTRLWQYEVLCMVEVLGYTFAGPIANQVLIAQWFHFRRGRAMGYAYLGLGFGGVVSPPLVNYLIHAFGWRHALGATGIAILALLLPVELWITRSTPAEMGLAPDGADPICEQAPRSRSRESIGVVAALRTVDFWLILLGSSLVIGAVNAVIQHFILFLKDQGYSTTTAASLLSTLLAVSLIGRVLVGYLSDRFQRKNIMTLFYFLLGVTIPLLFLARQPIAAWAFAGAFGFSMGADYMLIPLVTADCFGIGSLGKLLAIIIMGYSLGQWIAPWAAGKLFDTYGSYGPAWKMFATAAVLGSIAIYRVSTKPESAMADVARMRK